MEWTDRGMLCAISLNGKGTVTTENNSIHAWCITHEHIVPKQLKLKTKQRLLFFTFY